MFLKTEFLLSKINCGTKKFRIEFMVMTTDDESDVAMCSSEECLWASFLSSFPQFLVYVVMPVLTVSRHLSE